MISDDASDWRTPIKKYITKGVTPSDTFEKRILQKKSDTFYLDWVGIIQKIDAW